MNIVVDVFQKDRNSPGSIIVRLRNLLQYNNYSIHNRIKESVTSSYKLAVLVPYRECFDNLMEFAPHMENFLSDHGIPHKIIVLNQVDKYM